MKVDIQKMNEACDLLRNLQHRLNVVESEIQSVLKSLAQQRFFNEVGDELLTNSLASQLKTVKQREENVAQFAQVLGSINEKYQYCEKKAQELYSDKAGNNFHKIDFKFVEKQEFVPAYEITKIIHKYIMPFIKE